MPAAPARRPSPRVTALLAGAVAVLWTAAMAQVFVVAPPVKKRYDEYGLQLPPATRSVIGLSQWATRYGLAVVPLGVAAMLAVVGWLALFRPRPRWTAAADLLAALLIGLLVTANLTVAGALVLPQVKLVEGLSK